MKVSTNPSKMMVKRKIEKKKIGLDQPRNHFHHVLTHRHDWQDCQRNCLEMPSGTSGQVVAAKISFRMMKSWSTFSGLCFSVSRQTSKNSLLLAHVEKDPQLTLLRIAKPNIFVCLWNWVVNPRKLTPSKLLTSETRSVNLLEWSSHSELKKMLVWMRWCISVSSYFFLSSIFALISS